jgi:hypothetical protein
MANPTSELLQEASTAKARWLLLLGAYTSFESGPKIGYSEQDFSLTFLCSVE